MATRSGKKFNQARRVETLNAKVAEIAAINKAKADDAARRERLAKIGIVLLNQPT